MEQPSKVRRRVPYPQRGSLRILSKILLHHSTRNKDPTLIWSNMKLKMVPDRGVDPDSLDEITEFAAQRPVNSELIPAPALRRPGQGRRPQVSCEAYGQCIHVPWPSAPNRAERPTCNIRSCIFLGNQTTAKYTADFPNRTIGRERGSGSRPRFRKLQLYPKDGRRTPSVPSSNQGRCQSTKQEEA